MEAVLKQSTYEHAALAQVYRWYQIYDLDQSQRNLDVLLKVIRDDFILYTIDGTIRGKEQYLVRLHIQRNWRNSHHIKNTRFSLKKNGEFLMEVETNYQNILPDGSFNTYKVNHQINLVPVTNNLPLITEVRLIPVKINDEPHFVRTYKDNRSFSFMHYLLYCFENFAGDLTDLNDLFKPDFTIQINDYIILNTQEDFSIWIRNTLAQFKGCICEPKNIKVIEITKDKANITFDVSWILAGTMKVMGSTNYSCLIHYCINEAFPKLEAMKVKKNEPIV